jgi:hypothetical protein
MPNITWVTSIATGATFSGLPAGVSGSWVSNVVTIGGTPTVVGTFPYTVTLTGGCGTTTLTGTITVSATNTITFSSATGTNAQTRCVNTAITNITYSTTGATGASFSGLPPGVNGVWAGNVATISGAPLVSGVFNYTVTATGGCGNITATGTITVNALPVLAISPTAAAFVCRGSSITLTASGATSYTWSPGATLNTTTGATVIATPTLSTNYTVTGTDGNGCQNSISKFVTVLNLPTITVTPFTVAPICQGATVNLNAFGATTYTWAPTAGLNVSTGSSVAARPDTTTTYTVTGTDGNGCQNTATKTITVIPSPDSKITPRGYVNTCENDTVHLMAKAGYSSYVWRFYGTVVTPINSNTYPTVTGGYYTLTVTDATGCVSTTDSPTIITVISRPVSTITSAPGTTILNAGAGFGSYQWYLNGTAITGATSQFYTATAVGSYTVRLTETSALGCDALTPPYVLQTLSVGGTVPAESIRLYPNPASGIVYIESPIAISAVVTSMDGKQMFIGDAVNRIDLGAWPDGIYRVVLHDKNGAFLKMEKITKVTR